MKLQQKSAHWFDLLRLDPHPLPAHDVARNLLFQLYAPPSVLVDSHCGCVGFFGQIERYLNVTRDQENSNVFAIAHEGVRGRLKAALKLVWVEEGPVRADETDAEGNDGFDSMAILVLPIQIAHESFLLVSFLEGQACEQGHPHARIANGFSPPRPPEIFAPSAGSEEKQPASLGLLSPRQRAVLDLVVNGRSNKQIAWDLGISRRTVETHRVIAMRKLGAKNVADLMRLVAAA